MGYEVVHTDDVERVDLSQVEGVPPDLDIGPVGQALNLEHSNVTLWYFDPGEEIGYHAHAEQEEVYYVVEGTFSLKLGRSGEEEFVEVGPGTFWKASAMVGHGHRNVGDDRGIVLAIGAPPVDDPGLDPHDLDDA